LRLSWRAERWVDAIQKAIQAGRVDASRERAASIRQLDWLAAER